MQKNERLFYRVPKSAIREPGGCDDLSKYFFFRIIAHMAIASLLGLLFPQRCPLCEAPAHASRALPICESCWATIQRYTGPACSLCGLPAVSHHTERCQECVSSPPMFVFSRSYGIYEGVLKKAIHFLKFDGKRRLAKPLAALLCELSLPAVDAVVPVPLHISRLRKREFNQTALIGKHLAGHLRISLRTDLLIKTKATAAQIDVDRQERLKNLKKAFTASKDVAGLRILLIDDVVTTGATARESAKALKNAGAEEVFVVALARSLPKC
ncbi:MAG TPA: ComF family protein [Dissulfurispiraceae bacterium]|nr:ComF family protein [Dissulfurispiraceae bacterium]